jgi:hypothetical protein
MRSSDLIVLGPLLAIAVACGGSTPAEEGGAGPGGGEPEVAPGTSGGAGRSEGAVDRPDGGDTGPLPDGAPLHQSGTRIKAQWAVTQDGLRAFAGWYDAERKERCELLTASDGKMRCLPFGQKTDIFPKSYAGAQCAAEVFAITAACTAPSVIRARDGERARIHPLGAKDNAVFQNDSGTCEPHSSTVTSYYAIGAEIPAASFVEFTSTPATTSARLAERFWLGSDGSHQFIGWVDQQLKAGCSFKPTREGIRCVPVAPIADHFSDAACKVPVASTETTATTKPSFASRLGATCGEPPTLFRVGDAVSGDALRRFDGATCAAAAGPRKAWALAEMSPAELVGPAKVEQGSGRIRASYDVTREDGRRQLRELVDTQLGNVPCSFREAADGKVRCMPALMNVEAAGHYADAACTKAFRFGTTTKGNCTPQRFGRGPAAQCMTEPAQYYSLKTDRYPGRVYLKSGSNCIEVFANNDIYEMEAAVPPTTFAEGSFVVDP